MIDLNGNPEERKAVEEASALRHEAPIFVGSIPDDDKHRRLVAEREKALNRLYANESQLAPAARQALKDRIDDLNLQIADFQQYKEVRFENDLARLALHKKSITTLIISGHHGQGKFFGTNGTLDAEKIRRALAGYPEVSGGLKSLILAGCYSATPGAINDYWKSLSPKLTLIAGYDALAPKGATAESPIYLSEILAKEKELLSVRDKKTLQTVFGKIRFIRSINASVYVNDLFVDKNGAFSLDELKSRCDAILQGTRLDKMNETVACYDSAQDKACENPPADTQNGELRKVYNQANTLSLCNDIFRAAGKEPPDVEHLLRLIFFGKVVRNLAANHSSELQALDQALRQLGFQNTELFGSIANVSRREAVNRVAQAQNKIEQKLADRATMASASGPAVAQAQEHLGGLERILVRLHPSCTPQTWIEGTSRERSPCLRLLDATSLGRLSALGFATALEYTIGQEIAKNDPIYDAAKREKDQLEEQLAKDKAMTSPERPALMRQLRAARVKMTQAANDQSRRVYRKVEDEFEKEITRRQQSDPRFSGSAAKREFIEALAAIRANHRDKEAAAAAFLQEMSR